MSFQLRAGVCGVFLAIALAAPAMAIPYGTYQTSCKDIKLKDRDSDSTRIQAKCRDSKGEWRKTSFELDRCWGDLANIDGELVCVADQRQDSRSGFGDQGYPNYPARGNPGAPPAGRPKDVAVDVCVDYAVGMAYRDGAGFARLLKIEDVDRKDAGRVKVKGVVLTGRDREARSTKDRPFRCDSRQGQVLDFKWR